MAVAAFPLFARHKDTDAKAVVDPILPVDHSWSGGEFNTRGWRCNAVQLALVLSALF
jgi:hypothetical protein